jgi:hypothetical protein
VRCRNFGKIVDACQKLLKVKENLVHSAVNGLIVNLRQLHFASRGIGSCLPGPGLPFTSIRIVTLRSCFLSAIRATRAVRANFWLSVPASLESPFGRFPAC